MDLLLLQYLKKFAQNKLGQARPTDPFVWSKILEYVNQEIEKIKK
jgi:hypothetical protein